MGRRVGVLSSMRRFGEAKSKTVSRAPTELIRGDVPYDERSTERCTDSCTELRLEIGNCF